MYFDAKMVRYGYTTRTLFSQYVQSITEKQTIFNHSSRILTQTEAIVLKKGLKYGIKSKRIGECEILARFEELAQSLNKLKTKDTHDPS